MNPASLASVHGFPGLSREEFAQLTNGTGPAPGCEQARPLTSFGPSDQTIISEATFPVPRFDDGDPLLNRRLGHFRITSRLGQGGMGVVYRAVDESLQRYVALKVIHPSKQGADDSRQIDRLLAEARAQARLCHPHVAQVYFVGREEETPFLAMELAPGETLEQRLQSGPLPFEEVVRIAVQTCRALAAASRIRIVHGDIKPANLLFAGDGSVKLSDFGLARPLEQSSPCHGPLAGTPNYLSPEACRGQSTDHRSDMYSLGVMLFEMTFGRLPYTFPSAAAALRLTAHQSWPAEYPQPWPEDVPAAWKQLLERLLEKDPQRRFASYEELLAQLDRFKPQTAARAGRIVRPLAWACDLGLMLVFVTLITQLFAVGHFSLQARFLTLMGPGLSAATLLVASMFQAVCGTTVGKLLFQIRIADRHGQTPPQPALFCRMIAQLLPLWAMVCYDGFRDLSLPSLALASGLGLGLVAAINAAFALLRPDGRSLHDIVFRTRVLLDATPRSAAGP